MTFYIAHSARDFFLKDPIASKTFPSSASIISYPVGAWIRSTKIYPIKIAQLRHTMTSSHNSGR